MVESSRGAGGDRKFWASHRRTGFVAIGFFSIVVAGGWWDARVTGPVSSDDPLGEAVIAGIQVRSSVEYFTDKGILKFPEKTVPGTAYTSHGIYSFRSAAPSYERNETGTLQLFQHAGAAPASNIAPRFDQQVVGNETRQVFSSRAANGDIWTFAMIGDEGSDKPAKRVFVFVNGEIQSVQTMSYRRKGKSWAPHHIKTLLFRAGLPKVHIEQDFDDGTSATASV